MKHLKVLLINPFIYDFAAYNFWSKPLGILYIGSILKKNGLYVSLIDCMEVKKKKEDGRGHYVKEVVKKPDVLKSIDKPFRRYGISEEELRRRLLNIERPDLVLVTSIMTYWYLGTLEVVRVIRETYPTSKIVVGGIYPTLCEEHARESLWLADLLVKKGELKKLYDFIEGTFYLKLDFKPEEKDFDSFPRPLFELYENCDFIPILTSIGCPFSCTYCASRVLNPKIVKRRPEEVFQEILHWTSLGIKKFVLYDDCFLEGRDDHAIPILKMLKGLKVEFFNPNAVNARFVNLEVAELLFEAGFKEVRLGLETVDPVLQRRIGIKFKQEEFEDAVMNLKRAGYGRENLRVYILVGLPFQHFEDVKRSVDYVIDLGCTPELSEYSPVPKTELFENYKMHSRFPIEDEPLFQNNSLHPFAWEGLREKEIQELKAYVREKLTSLRGPIQDVPQTTLN